MRGRVVPIGVKQLRNRPNYRIARLYNRSGGLIRIRRTKKHNEYGQKEGKRREQEPRLCGLLLPCFTRSA